MERASCCTLDGLLIQLRDVHYNHYTSIISGHTSITKCVLTLEFKKIVLLSGMSTSATTELSPSSTLYT